MEYSRQGIRVLPRVQGCGWRLFSKAISGDSVRQGEWLRRGCVQHGRAGRLRAVRFSLWELVAVIELTKPKRFGLTAEPAEAAEEHKIFRVNPAITVPQSRNAFFPAWMKEGPIASDSAISAISAVKNLG